MAALKKAFSLRVLISSACCGGLCGALAALLWTPLGPPIAGIMFVGAWLAFITSNESAAVCPHCSKLSA